MSYYLIMNKTPQKNLHLEHPEDCILTGDLTVLDWFVESDSTVSVKIDGAPAVVFGTDPETGKFFVGTKSVFNKKKIKINYSIEDILRNHGNTVRVAEILIACFDNLPRIDGIIQGCCPEGLITKQDLQKDGVTLLSDDYNYHIAFDELCANLKTTPYASNYYWDFKTKTWCKF